MSKQKNQTAVLWKLNMIEKILFAVLFVLNHHSCQEDQCQLYSENVQCQDALKWEYTYYSWQNSLKLNPVFTISCEGLGFECVPEDSTGMACSGMKLDLYKTDNDFCGWCSSSWVQMLEVWMIRFSISLLWYLFNLKEGQTCRLTTNGGEVYVSSIKV